MEQRKEIEPQESQRVMTFTICKFCHKSDETNPMIQVCSCIEKSHERCLNEKMRKKAISIGISPGLNHMELHCARCEDSIWAVLLMEQKQLTCAGCFDIIKERKQSFFCVFLILAIIWICFGLVSFFEVFQFRSNGYFLGIWICLGLLLFFTSIQQILAMILRYRRTEGKLIKLGKPIKKNNQK